MTIKEQCIHLREEGKTYNEICTILHCSKSTVAYHLNTTTKIAATKWQSENKCKDWKYKFMHSCSKHDLTIEEYLSLCKQVLEHHGYTVSKT